MHTTHTTIRNGGESAQYRAARFEACAASIAQGDWDALDAYDAAGCYMPEGGMSDTDLEALAWDEFVASIK